MQYHYVPDVQVSSNVDFNFGNLGEQPSEPKAPTFVQVQRETANADLSIGEAFWNSWLYGGTLGAIYNGITKPGISDDGWVKNQKLSAWQQARRILGPAVQHQDFRNYWEDNIKSAYDAKWFIDAAQNKIAVKAAEDQHFLASLGAQMLDPVDIAIPLGLGKVSKVKRLYEAIEGLTGLKRTAAYGAMGAVAGATTEVPQVLYNFEDDASVLTGAALGAGLYALAGKLSAQDLNRLSNRRRVAEDKPPAQAFEQAAKNPTENKSNAPLTPSQKPVGASQTPLTQGTPIDPQKLPENAPIEPVRTGNQTVDTLVNPPRVNQFGNVEAPPKTPKQARISFLKRFGNSFLGLDSEVHSIFPALAEATMTLAHIGGKKIYGSTSIAKQNYDYIRAQNIAKLQQQLLKIPGWMPNGALQNINQLRGTANLLSEQQKFHYTRMAQGYLATKYNYQSSINAINGIIQRVNGVLANDSGRLQMFELDAAKQQVMQSQKALRDYVKEANAKIRKENKQAQQAYKKALKEYSKVSQLKGADKSYPSRPDKPVLQEQIDIPVDLYEVMYQPDINKLPATARALVDAYVNSGVSRALGKVLRDAGQNFIESDYYMHLAIDPDRFDALAQAHVPVIKARVVKRLDDIQGELKTLKTTIRNNQKALKQNSNDSALIGRLQMQNEMLSGLYKQRARLKAMGDDQYLMQAYSDISSDYGEQIFQAFQRARGSEFKGVTKSQIGALLVISRIKDIGGHNALFKFLKRQRQAMGSNLNADVIRELAEATNMNFNEISKDMLNKLDLSDLVYHATAERRTNAMQIIGQSNMLKKRYREDYMRPGSITGLSPYEFLQGDMYTMAQKMVMEQTARASLMGRRVMKQGATGKNIQDFLDLGTPEGLTVAARHLTDLAQKKGYNKQKANEIADMWLNSVLGRPIGDPEDDWLQVLRAVAGTMFLKNSGLFNLADIAQLCIDFSYREVAKAMLPAMKMGFTFSNISKGDMNTISGMLAKTLAAEGRLVPQVRRVGEDLQDVSKNKFIAGAHYFAQYGRFANGSEFIRNFQNNIGSLIYETRLLQALQKGQDLTGFISEEAMALARKEYAKHGKDFSKWNQDAKRKVIGAGNEVMSNIILSLRAGERPRFLSTTMGRAVFAYQSFIFAAHKKLLMRYKNNLGMLQLTHLILVQMTAGIGIVALAQMLAGKDPTKLSPQEFGVQLGTSVSALGLFGAALTAVARGQIGGTTPALSAATNIAKLPYNIAQGNFQEASKGVPLLSIFLPFRAVMAALTGEF